MNLIQSVIESERYLLRRATGIHEFQTARSARVEWAQQCNEVLRHLHIELAAPGSANGKREESE